MEEIEINKKTFLGYWVSAIYLGGDLLECPFQAVISPKSFAEPTMGKVLVGVLEDGHWANTFLRPLADGEIEVDNAIRKWVEGLVKIELSKEIVCRACGAKGSISFNPGIEKVWCSNCGVDASRIEFSNII
jgi:ribosomal protein L37E